MNKASSGVGRHSRSPRWGKLQVSAPWLRNWGRRPEEKHLGAVTEICVQEARAHYL